LDKNPFSDTLQGKYNDIKDYMHWKFVCRNTLQFNITKLYFSSERLRMSFISWIIFQEEKDFPTKENSIQPLGTQNIGWPGQFHYKRPL